MASKIVEQLINAYWRMRHLECSEGAHPRLVGKAKKEYEELLEKSLDPGDENE